MVGTPPVEAMKRHHPYMLPVVVGGAAVLAYIYYRHLDRQKHEEFVGKYGNLRPVTPAKDLVKVPLNDGQGSGSALLTREEVKKFES